MIQVRSEIPVVVATNTLQRGGHRKLLALPKLSHDSLGAMRLNCNVVYQDGCSKPHARICGAVRRQASWCTGGHSVWAVRLPDNVLWRQHVELLNKLRICASNLRMRPWPLHNQKVTVSCA